MKSPSKKLNLGLIILSFFLGLLVVSFFLPQTLGEMELSAAYQAPSWPHIFGTDENGVDVLFQIIKGSQVSFFVAFSVTLISLMIGLIVGTISGCFGKMWDAVLMRVVDMVYAFPNFLLALSLMAVLQASVGNLIFVLCLSSWASYARLVRGEILHLKKKEFVCSAESLGAGFFRKIIFHIWPNLIPVLSVQTALTLAGVILAESGLSFLGVGVSSDIPTWGALLRSGRQALQQAPFLSLFPGIFLFSLILAFHLTGRGLKELFSRGSS